METKKCNKCEELFLKTNEYFSYVNRKKGYFSPYCKVCDRARCRKFHKDNYGVNEEWTKKRVESSKKSVLKNPELYTEIKRRWYEKNRELVRQRNKARCSTEEFREKRNKRHKERYATEPAYRMRRNVGGAVYDRLSGRRENRNKTVWKALPYTPQELKEHIESQFEPWMTWDNYGNGHGQWNIDHIYPQSKLPYDSLEHPNFQKCWALENLRPLCAIKNTQKKDKVFSKCENYLVCDALPNTL